MSRSIGHRPGLFLWSSLVLPLLVLAASLHGEILYDNTSTYTGKTFGSTNEFGEDIEFEGDGERYKITAFKFEYYAKANTSLRLRLYDHQAGEQGLPHTLIYDVSAMSFMTGYNSMSIEALDFTVSRHITWTVTFTDPSGALLIYGPPDIGQSSDDYLEKTTVGWRRLSLSSGAKANFSARVEGEALDKVVPTVKLLSPRVVEGMLAFDLSGAPLTQYRIETSIDLARWVEYATLTVTSSATKVTFPLHDQCRFYRVVQLP